ncbi:hypothetical protein D3C76_1274280 [compost metagenome]
MLAVGVPNCRASFWPCSTRPAIRYGRPSSRSARAKSAAASALRTWVLLTRMPSSSTVCAASTVKPCMTPACCRKSKSPTRSQPKRKSSPTSRCCTPSPSTRMVSTNSLALSLLRRWLKARHRTRSTPSAANSCNLSRNRARRAGAVSGAKNSRGCGSKITTQLGTPNSSARSRSRARIAW